MYDNNSKGISYTAGFFILIAFTIAGLVLASIISIPVWQQMTGLGIKEMASNMNNPAYGDTMQVIQVINEVVGFFVPAVVTAAILNRRPIKLLGFSSGVKWTQAGLAIVIIVMGLFVSSSLAYFNEHIPLSGSLKTTFDNWENEYNDQVQAIISLKGFKDYLVALVIMAFLPALCEETLFRGGLQNFLTRSTRKPWLSIVIVSILFSLAHVSFYGFLSRFFLGMILGAIFYYSGKIWLNILAHFINNAIALTALYIYIQQGKPAAEAMKDDVTSFWGIVFLPFVVLFLVIFKRVSAGRRLV